MRVWNKSKIFESIAVNEVGLKKKLKFGKLTENL